jgi:hypothetical protein
MFSAEIAIAWVRQVFLKGYVRVFLVQNRDLIYALNRLQVKIKAQKTADFILPPNLIWALIPAVAATLENTVSTFRLSKSLGFFATSNHL